jgi:FkbM family methyltransferase
MISEQTMLGLRRLTVVLKKVPGMVLLLEPLRRMAVSRGGILEVSDFDGCMKMKLRLDEHMQSQIFWYGSYSRDIILLLDRILEPGHVVADVGANIGEISLAAARRVGKTGKVHSFEPMSLLFNCLVQNSSMNNLKQIMPVQQGVSAGLGKTTIYAQEARFKDGTRHSGLGTIYPFGDRSVPVEEIELTTLDYYFEEHPLERLDLIKLDVEGAEHDVLRGALHTIRRHRPYIILELQEETAQSAGNSAETIRSTIESNQYDIYKIGRKAKLSRLTPEGIKRFQNVLCVPNGKRVP